MTVKKPESIGKELIPYVGVFLCGFAILTLGGVGLRYAALIPYIFIFLFFCWKRPPLALMFIFCLAPFQQDILGGGPIHLAFSELSLALFLIMFFFRRQGFISLGPITFPVLTYFIICVGLSFINWRGPTTVISLFQMFLYFFGAVTVFAYFAERKLNFTYIFNAFIIVCIVLSVRLIINPAPYVWGLHKNGIGDSLASALIVCVGLWWSNDNKRKRLLLNFAMIILVVGLFFSLSRGAWLGAFSGIFLFLALKRKFSLLLRLAIILIPIIAICWRQLPQGTREYVVDFSAERRNIAYRYKSLEFAMSMFEQNPIYGMGVGLRKEFDATNVITSVLAETGIIGAIPFILIHIAFFIMVWKTRRRLDPKSYMFSILIIGAALHMNRLMHGMVDHYWSRGTSMIGWAGTGMAIGVYLACLNERKQEKAS